MFFAIAQNTVNEQLYSLRSSNAVLTVVADLTPPTLLNAFADYNFYKEGHKSWFTKLLGRHNRLDVTIAADSDQGGLWGEVALEIRCSAYLRDMQATRRDDGAVVELYRTPCTVRSRASGHSTRNSNP